MRDKGPGFKFAVCINNADYPASLELHKIYRVLPDEDVRPMVTSGSWMKAVKITSTQPCISSLWTSQDLLKSPYCELRNLADDTG